MNIHRRRKVHLGVTLFLVLGGSFGVCLDSASAAPKPMATVLGRVLVKRKNLATTTTLQANDKLYPGDVVATSYSSNASVQFSDGSRVDMAQRSVMEITSRSSVGGAKTLFRALNGRMAAHLRPGKVVATRTALVRVKGTVILISVEDDGTSTLSVLEGAAEFFNPCGSVLVPAGAQSVVQPGNAPTAPSAIPDVGALLRNWQDQSGVLSPFVGPNANIPVPPTTAPVVYELPDGAPEYLHSAVARLKAVPLTERIQALASIKPTTNPDCGCAKSDGRK